MAGGAACNATTPCVLIVVAIDHFCVSALTNNDVFSTLQVRDVYYTYLRYIAICLCFRLADGITFLAHDHFLFGYSKYLRLVPRNGRSYNRLA